VDTGPKKKIALLYARVSTSMQVNDGMSLDAQERDLRRAAALSGYDEVELLREEGRSGKSIKGRPVLRGALERLDRGDAEALFVTRIDRLARSTQDFLSIIDRAGSNGWRIVMLDLNLDTSSYQGRFVVTIMSALAEMERAIIAERQKDVHRDRREKGLVWGVDLGPKPMLQNDVVDQIFTWRESGLSMWKIADRLNKAETPTAYGSGHKWYASTIKYVLENYKKKGPGEQST
jgi:DNA invertase Pin-like site-specific DNA recombinase